MKSAYFSPDNIDGKSWQMLRTLENYGTRHGIAFIPERAALLIIDMQRYFLDRDSHAYVPSAPPIVPRIKKLADAFLKRNLEVVLTRHVNSKGDAGVLAEWWEDMITEGDPLSEIIAEFDATHSSVIKKTQYDAFYGTPLMDLLRERDAKQLVVTGVMTHLCCETTARSAFVRGFKVFLPVDGTATYSEDFHRAALLNLSHGFAVPVLVEDLITSLER